jgi:hypothetical protein
MTFAEFKGDVFLLADYEKKRALETNVDRKVENVFKLLDATPRIV